MELNILDGRLVEGGGGGESGFVPVDPGALNKITEVGGLPRWNGSAWPGGSSGGGDMFKAVYDPDGDGKFGYPVLPAAGITSGTYAAGDDSRFHVHTNAASLAKITESGGAPLWNGSAWPSAVPGAVTSLSWTNGIMGVEVSTQSLKLTGGVISALNSSTATDGKAAVIAVRDVRSSSDEGTTGNVNTTLNVVAHTNAVQKQSEWGLTSITNLFTSSGQCGIVSVYGQANARQVVSKDYPLVGGIWGIVGEACDMTYGGETTRGVYGGEFDCWVSGNQQNAHCLLLVVGDSKLIRTETPSADKRASSAITLTSEGGARFRQGISCGHFSEEGIVCYQYGTYAYTGLKALQAVRLEGDYSNGFLNLAYGTAPKGIIVNSNCTLSTGLAVDIGESHAYGVNGVPVLRRRSGGWFKVTGTPNYNVAGSDWNIDNLAAAITNDLTSVRGYLISNYVILLSLINILRFNGVIYGNPNGTANADYITPPL